MPNKIGAYKGSLQYIVSFKFSYLGNLYDCYLREDPDANVYWGCGRWDSPTYLLGFLTNEFDLACKFSKGQLLRIRPLMIELLNRLGAISFQKTRFIDLRTTDDRFLIHVI
jgi:hypothetical protein